MKKTNREKYIDREMSNKKYYATIMIPSSSVMEVCKKVNRKHRDKATSRFIKDHIEKISDEFMTYRDALEYIYDFITRFKGKEPPYEHIYDYESLAAQYEKDASSLFWKLSRVGTIAYKATRADNRGKGSKERIHREEKPDPPVQVTKEKVDRTIDIIMKNLYKNGDFCNIDTSKEKERQIKHIRRQLGIQNINFAQTSKMTKDYVRRAFKYGYANRIHTKDYIESSGFIYEYKQYTYQFTEEEIISISLQYNRMSQFRINNFNMWLDAERKGLLDLMHAYCYHSSGRGGFNVNAPGILYYIKSQGVYKIGITNLTVEQRFSHVWQKIEVIKKWSFDNGQDARNEEKRILREFAYAKHNAEGIEGLGNTELFTYDVLQLDS